MKKLFQINVVANWGSTGRIAEEIGIVAMKKGWESYIAYGRGKPSSKSHLIRVGNNLDMKIHGIKTRLFDMHGLGSKNATITLIKQIKKIKPTIIHLHNIHGYYLNIEILFNFLSIADIPIVWTLHDYWSFTGHCTFFDLIGCNKWKTQCNKCPNKREFPASIIVDRSYKNFQLKKKLFNSVTNITLVPVSYWLESLVKQSFLYELPTKVIHNGINTSLFSPQQNSNLREKYKINDSFILLGVANSWPQRKGLLDFINLSKRLDNKTKIVLVGLNNHQIKSLPRNIIGIKRTDSIKELAQLYTIADIVLNLSAEETFGLTTVEGLACGTPGIVYNCTASPELLSKETGMIVEKGDITGIINAINTVRNNGKTAYSDVCRKHVMSNFNSKDRYKDYFKLYSTVISEFK